MSTTGGGVPPHSPVENPPPKSGVTAKDVLEAFEAFKATLLDFLAEHHD